MFILHELEESPVSGLIKWRVRQKIHTSKNKPLLLGLLHYLGLCWIFDGLGWDENATLDVLGGCLDDGSGYNHHLLLDE